jgi:hypothetical protein
MKRLLGLLAVLAVCIGGSSAFAASPNQPTCSGGAIAPGTYNGLTVTGVCTVMGAVTVNGNVTVADGAWLDAAYLDTQMTINGNVMVGTNSTLGLGCSFGYHDCGFNPKDWIGNVTVNGNIIANQSLTMYLDFTTVHGNVIVNGGGNIALVDHPPVLDGLVLPIKDDTIDGNLVVHGWEGAWFGAIRDHVGGNVMISNVVGTRIGGDDTPDSTEVVTNVIAGNLICQNNTPAAQIGDSGGSVNQVDGNKIGECTAV